VIAGAPGNNRVRLNAGFLWQFRSNHRRGDEAHPIVPASKLPAITNAVVAACDAKDGVVDRIVDDPRACEFDPASLQCSAEDRPECLTADQVAALTRMYAGVANPRTKEQIYPGWPKSSESGWQQYWGTTEPARVNFWRYWVFENPKWDPWTFDFDRDLTHADAKVGRWSTR
jgi:feruloyl esterase